MTESLNKMKGVFFLIMVIIIWVGSATMIRLIFTSDDTEFSKPLFLTYYSTAFFTLYLIPLLVKVIQLYVCKHPSSQSSQSSSSDGYSQLELSDSSPQQRVEDYGSLKQEDINHTLTLGQQRSSALGKTRALSEQKKALKEQVRYVVWLSLIFCLFWFLANYTYNFGLTKTSVSSSTVLSNTSSIFVYIIGLIFLHDKFHPIKGLFVLVSFCGVVAITLEDNKQNEGEDSQDHNILGDVFSLLSAVFYAIYATYLKFKVPEDKESTFKFSYFLGFVGLFNIFLLFPLFFIFNATGIEPFEWPNQKTFLFLTLNAFVGTFISDYCWVRSAVLLGPLITTLGISLTIPLSLVSSVFFDDISFSWMYLGGSAMILASFVVIAYIDYKQELRKKLEKEKKFEDTERDKESKVA